MDEIKAILAPIAEKYRVEAILLFGSCAKGLADGYGDVDWIGFGGSQFRPTDIFAMSEEIRSALRKQADVYEIRKIPPAPLSMTPFSRKECMQHEIHRCPAPGKGPQRMRLMRAMSDLIPE